jgi:hypothetical protein
LRRAGRRYHRLPVPSRPTLADPGSYCTLFTLLELFALARARYWPLPGPALAWLREPPAARARRRRREAGRIAGVVREVLAAELPEALPALLNQMRRRGHAEAC